VNPSGGDTGTVDDISLIVTDLDGTLWHTDGDIHPRTVAALRTLLDAEVPVLVATGRRRTSARGPLVRIGVTPPAIVLNGALGLDLATDERFHCAPFPGHEASAVLRGFRDIDLEPCVYVDHPTVETFLDEQPSTHPRHAASLAPAAEVADLEQVCATVPVLAFSVIGVRHGRLAPAAERLAAEAEVHLDRSLDHPGLASLTVAPHRQSKWDGVLAFCRTRGVAPDRVVALGDGSNDIELLTNAALSLVPAAAHPAALACADRIIGAPGDGGWADVLDHVA
jgi:HAD superfamily hydrolase (TIGR01484 family)